MSVDLFEKLSQNRGPLGSYSKYGHGYFFFPKLEGDINPIMTFRGKEVLTWSLNNYLGLANHPEVREADAKAAKDFGMAYPMGARMMSGNSSYHEKLESEFAEFIGKEDAVLVNFGYQAMVSAIDCLVDRRDVIVYDADSHACIVDGVRLHAGKRFVFTHNDMASLRKQLERATKLADENGGAILVITEGVFGMSGNIGKLDEVVALKKEFDFRLFVDDAHGFGVLGPKGEGAPHALGCQDGVDIYFATFAKSLAGIGAFIASNEQVAEYLRYNMRSQVFAKSLPMPMVIGGLKRMEIIKRDTTQKDKLWTIVNALQGGLIEAGFNIGTTNSPVTPVFLSAEVTEAPNMIMDLRENYNIFCSMVMYPVVPKGVVMLRLIPTASHTLEQVEQTIKAFSEVKVKLDKGVYTSGTLEELGV